MNDIEFNTLADAVLSRIEYGLEASGADLDFAMVSAGVLEIEFADGSKIVVNRHGAAKEIWVAARSGGFHFRWDGKAWRDTRDGRELLVMLSALVSAQANEPVTLDGVENP
jgi:CyaY protein